MKNLRNKNQPPSADIVQTYLETSYDVVKAVYDNLSLLAALGSALEDGDIDSFLAETDIDTLAELNNIVADATLGDAADFATAAQGLLADNSIQGPFANQTEAEAGVDNIHAMTPLRVAQAIIAFGGGIQNNFTGTVAPTVTDDANAGYAAGSVWINSTASPAESYRCADPTIGAAVWVKTTLTSDELAVVGLTGNSDDLIEGVTKLLLTVAERTKLATVETDAKDDQTGPEIKALYEAEANTNAFTDSEKTALGTAVLDSDFIYSDGVLIKTGAGTYSSIKVNHTATTDPAAGNDSNSGYSPGSQWTNVTGDSAWVCVDATVGAAVWIDVSSGSGGGLFGNYTATTNPGVSNDNTESYVVGSVWVNVTADTSYMCMDSTTGAAVWMEITNTTAGGGGGGMTALYKNTNYTLTANDLVYSEAGLTHTLPATPTTGQKCSVWDMSDNAGTSAITVLRNGETIDGVADDFSLNMDGGRVDFMYDGSGWIYSYVVQTVQTLYNRTRIVTGTTDTLLSSDNGKEVIYTNAAAIAVTLPDDFPEGWNCVITQTTAAGVPTVTPTTDTINGAGTGVAPSGQWKGMHISKYTSTAYIAKI